MPRCGRSFSLPVTLFWSQDLRSEVPGKCFHVSRFRCIQGLAFTFLNPQNPVPRSYLSSGRTERISFRGSTQGGYVKADFVPFFSWVLYQLINQELTLKLFFSHSVSDWSWRIHQYSADLFPFPLLCRSPWNPVLPACRKQKNLSEWIIWGQL